MIFTSLEFIAFFLILMLLFPAINNQTGRKILLLASSYFFYAFWDWRFLFLILLSTAAGYYFGKEIYRSENATSRKAILISSIIANLGFLGLFKYFNFFIESANTMFGKFGFNLSALNIILPIGISFYTFEILSYTIDIYRKNLKPEKSTIDFAIFIAFFPKLIAGPIVRATEFLPQLKNKIEITKANFSIGIQIFLIGAFKKVVIADRMAFFSDPVFSNPSLYTTYTVWLALAAYTIQIFCDFSGYSDMAVGIAKILGFDLPMNFNIPYASQNPSEFWRRWHITLSRWLRDYLYIPLGGNRKGKTQTYINLFLTMFMGGLWHGASWNFVFWGLWHGGGLSVHKILSGKKTGNQHPFSFISWFGTIFFVMIGWIFFRSQDAKNTVMFLKRMFFVENFAINWTYSALYVLIPITIIAHIVGYKYLQEKYPRVNLASFSGAFIFTFILLGIILFYFNNPQPFIYFQF